MISAEFWSNESLTLPIPDPPNVSLERKGMRERLLGTEAAELVLEGVLNFR
jgi:hypothetical protein